MSFRRKILYYGLLLLLTLAVGEGMARIAYYAAYGPGDSRDGLAGAAGSSLAARERPAKPWQIRHPFYGYTRNLPYHDFNTMPPRQGRADTVVIGLLGGSVAKDVRPFFQRELNRRFVANDWPRQAIVLELAVAGQKQPQQAVMVAKALLLGGEFDFIVNLDGHNEITGSALLAAEQGVFPFYHYYWNSQVDLTTEELALIGNIRILRREQARLAAVGERSPLRRSALFGLANRWRQERIAAEIIQRNRELAAAAAGYSLEKYGPRNGAAAGELLPAAARVWYRGSLALSRLAELAGAEYYHFLQPSQYLPGSKRLTPQELARAYQPEGRHGPFIVAGYPLLRQFNGDLPQQGLNYFDLTGIFAGRRETLYRDDCCHLNRRGNELLAAAMVQRMEPALRRRAARPVGEPVSALAAARRPALSDTLLTAADFRVYRAGAGRWLRYVREDCAAADVEARFFLHLTPRNGADLPPGRQQHGFDNRDFSFGEVGGFLWRGQCRAEIRLPDYPIAYLRTGQYRPGGGEVWAADFDFLE